MRVSQQFYNLSRRCLFESLHFHDIDISRPQNLQELLAQRPPAGTATAGSWVKNVLHYDSRGYADDECLGGHCDRHCTAIKCAPGFLYDIGQWTF